MTNMTDQEIDKRVESAARIFAEYLKKKNRSAEVVMR